MKNFIPCRIKSNRALKLVRSGSILSVNVIIFERGIKKETHVANVGSVTGVRPQDTVEEVVVGTALQKKQSVRINRQMEAEKGRQMRVFCLKVHIIT